MNTKWQSANQYMMYVVGADNTIELAPATKTTRTHLLVPIAKPPAITNIQDTEQQTEDV